MLISIVIPVYNTEKYINDCIESLIYQTYKKIEMIFVDDGSTDKSLDIIKAYSLKDNRIKIIEQKNQGANIARGKGIKEAKGKYCLFIDSDDWIAIDTVDYLVKILNNNEYDIIKFNGMNEPSKTLKNSIISFKDTDKELKIRDAKRILLTTNNLNNMCFSIYKTSILKKINTFQKKMSNCEDYLANLEIYSKAKNIYLVSKIFYHYRENLSSTTKSNDKKIVVKNIRDFNYTFSKLFDYAKIWGIDNNDTINIIGFRIIDMIRANLFKYLKCKNVNKKEFKKLVNDFINTKSFNYINNNISKISIKKEFEKKSLGYKIKNLYFIKSFLKMDYYKTWNYYYLFKIIK